MWAPSLRSGVLPEDHRDDVREEEKARPLRFAKRPFGARVLPEEHWDDVREGLRHLLPAPPTQT